MHKRWSVALSAVLLSSLIPAVANAGSGGTPTAPGAGKTTDYCCTTLQRVDPRRQGDDGRGNNQTTPSFFNGTGCSAIDEDPGSRNACVGTVVKCRGEFFTPSEQRVDRCFTP